jgi:hypothetical protein
MGQAGTQDFPVGNTARSDRDGIIPGQRLDSLVQMMAENSSGVEVPAIRCTGKIAAGSKKRAPPLDRWFKWEVFETVQRVVVDKHSHGPVLPYDFTRQADDPSQFHAAGFLSSRRWCVGY